MNETGASVTKERGRRTAFSWGILVANFSNDQQLRASARPRVGSPQHCLEGIIPVDSRETDPRACLAGPAARDCISPPEARYEIGQYSLPKKNFAAIPTRRVASDLSAQNQIRMSLSVTHGIPE